MRRGEAWRGLAKLGEADGALVRFDEGNFIDFHLLFIKKQKLSQKEFCKLF